MSRRRLVAAAALVALLASCSGGDGCCVVRGRDHPRVRRRGWSRRWCSSRVRRSRCEGDHDRRGNTDEQVHVHGYDLYIEPEGPPPRVRRPHPRALRGRTRAVRSAPHRADGLVTRRRHLGIATVLAGVAMVGATPAGAHGIGGAPICRCRPGSWRGRRLRRCEFLCGARRAGRSRGSSPQQTVGGPSSTPGAR